MAGFTPQELKLDHFMFYQVAPQPAGQRVRLQCQFDKEPEAAQLTRTMFFANPAQKNDEPIYDKNAHFTFYNSYDMDPDPPRVVTYQNQFEEGGGELITGRSYGLLTPTWKLEPGSSFPQHLDHYRVYEVLHANPIQPTCAVQDQFGKYKVQAVYQKLFAVPCKKWYQSDKPTINNERAHLVLYLIRPESVQKAIRTRDQFGNRGQVVYRTVLFGVPTIKKDWKPYG